MSNNVWQADLEDGMVGGCRRMEGRWMSEAGEHMVAKVELVISTQGK